MIIDHKYLDKSRSKGDPEADHLLSSLIDSGKKEEVYNILTNSRKATTGELGNFLYEKKSDPNWLDYTKLQKGQVFFKKYAEDIMFLLGVMALPYCYAGYPGNIALYKSSKMRQNPGKRLMDTADFVLSVSVPGSFEEGGGGIYSINKTRLTHALARFYLLSGDWNNDWGQPINQEDMAGTNLAFSYIIINGLRKNGHILSRSEKEAFLHLWRYIGYQLRISEPLLPENYQQAFHLTQKIRSRNFQSSHEGQKLTDELISYYKKNVSSPQKEIISSQIEYFLGAEISSLLNIKSANPIAPFFTETFNSFRSISNLLGKQKSSFYEMTKRMSEQKLD